MNNFNFSVFIYSICAAWFFLAGAAQGVQFFQQPSSTWLAIAGLVVIPTLLGHSLFMYLINYMNINLMTCGKLIEPVMSSAIAYFLFGETLNPSTWIAFALTSTSVLILFFPWNRWLQRKGIQ